LGRDEVIVLDTHIWIWWVQNDPRLSDRMQTVLAANERTGLGVSAISSWEVAKSVELGRLTLPCPTEQWLKQALAYPGVSLVALTPRIAVESTQLPQPFHRDPGDQLIVATARVLSCPLLTADTKILGYTGVTHA
jgi:PIN domain nuclease of toxin-antitoxin system